MSDVGVCWYSTIVGRFFGGLKHDWLLKIVQLTRDHMKADVARYMRYYNLERLHAANGDISPVAYEKQEFSAAEMSSRFCSARVGSAALLGGKLA